MKKKWVAQKCTAKYFGKSFRDNLGEIAIKEIYPQAPFSIESSWQYGKLSKNFSMTRSINKAIPD